jgi:hypothetical protein
MMIGPRHMAGPYLNENHLCPPERCSVTVVDPGFTRLESTCHRGFLRHKPPHGWFPSLKLTLTSPTLPSFDTHSDARLFRPRFLTLLNDSPPPLTPALPHAFAARSAVPEFSFEASA